MFKKRQKITQSNIPASKKTRTKKSHKTFKIAFAALSIAVIFGTIWVGVFFATKSIIATTAPATADELYEKVQSYDYNNGHSKEIESDIKRLLGETINENTRDNYVKTLKAKAEYYYGLQKYYTAVVTFKELESYAADKSDMLYLAEHLAIAYDKFGNPELSKKYQDMYDDLTRKCAISEDSDETTDQNSDQESAE